MKLGDRRIRRKAVPVGGSVFMLNTVCVIMALAHPQSADPFDDGGSRTKKWGGFIVEEGTGRT
jgi:NADPH-dependent glutamate synthase beta subunit-like oxidoreductase